LSSSNNSAESEDLLEVGRIEKVHGLRGEVVVGLVSNMVDARTSAGAEFLAEGQRLQVVSARPHKNKWLVTFQGVSSREDAELLRGRTLLAEPLPSSAAEDGEADGFATEVVAFVHELIGLNLIDQHGTDHGEVISVLENPAADLLELANGRLVPLSFYESHTDTTVTVDVPVGLLDDDALEDRAPQDRAGS
jgi:16S rRNA processing protein RimM